VHSSSSDLSHMPSPSWPRFHYYPHNTRWSVFSLCNIENYPPTSSLLAYLTWLPYILLGPVVLQEPSSPLRHTPTLPCDLPFVSVSLSWDSTVSIATGHGLDNQGVGIQVPVGPQIFSFPRRPARLWGPPSLLSNGYWDLFPQG
jgi:hypothetical protein